MAAYEPGSTEPSTTFRVTLPRPPHRLAFDAALDGRVRHLSALQSQHSQLDDGRLVGTTLSPAGRVLQHFQLPWRVDDATLGFALQAGWLVLGPDPNRSDRRLVALDPAGQMLWARTLPGHFARLACNRGQRCVLDPGVAGQPLELLDFSGAVLATQAEIPPGQLLAATDGVGLQALFANQGPTTLMSLDPLPAQLLAQVPGNGRPLGTGLLESNGSTLRWVQGTSATWSRLLPGPLNGLSTLSPGRLHVVTGDWGGPLTLSTLDALTGNVRRSIALPANFPHVGTVTAASDDLDWLAAYDGELGFRELLAIDDGGIRQHLRTAGSISAMQALPAGGVVVETQPLATAQLSAGRLERHSLPLLADGFEGVD